MSRLISLTVTDFCRLRAARVQIHDGINRVVGPNGAGKSSLLNALAALLSGREVPEEPIRAGAETAEIIGETDGPDGLIIKRRFSKAGTTLLIESKDKSAKFARPQELLDKLTGGKDARLFDPSRFIRQTDSPEGRRAQANELRQLVGLDFTELDQKRAALFVQRTAANAAAADAEAHAKSLPQHEDAPAAEVSANVLLSEIDKANAHNQQIVAKDAEISRIAQDITNRKAATSGIEKRIAEIQAQLKQAQDQLRAMKLAAMELDDKMDAAKAERQAMQMMDTAPLRARLTGLEADNQKARDNAAKAKAHQAAHDKASAAMALSLQITDCDAQKAKTMADAKFPIPGLSFDDTGVRYQGKPFTQASDAEKIRVAIAVYAARKPTLRAMIIRDASLLDDNSLALLDRLAEEYSLQILLEIVPHGDEKAPPGAIEISDGTVKPTQK